MVLQVSRLDDTSIVLSEMVLREAKTRINHTLYLAKPIRYADLVSRACILRLLQISKGAASGVCRALAAKPLRVSCSLPQTAVRKVAIPLWDIMTLCIQDGFVERRDGSAQSH
jgi:hypothetical protein